MKSSINLADSSVFNSNIFYIALRV